MPGQSVIHVNGGTWKSEVLDSSVPVLVDFWAEWCGPCKAIAPVLEELAQEVAGKLKVVKVNVDEAGELAGQYQIRSIPTLLVFQGGTVQQQMVGAMNKATLKAKLGAFI